VDKSNKYNIYKKSGYKRIKGPNELNSRLTNLTPIKRVFKKRYLLQKLEDRETSLQEDLLQSVKNLEDSLLELSSIDTLAEVERLSEQIEKDLEGYNV
jgi:hypothetical protein